MLENKSISLPKQMNIPAGWRSWAKLGVSLFFLIWIISKIPMGNLKDSLVHAHKPDLLLAFFMVNLCMLVSVLKWRPLLTVLQIKISLNRLLAFYYVGLFANNFLPSSIGGDALRIYDVARESGKTSGAVASVVVERLMASLALGFTAAVAIVIVSQQSNAMVYWSVGGIIASCFFLLGIIFYYPFQEKGFIGRFLYRLGEYKKYPSTLALVLILSFTFQACLVLVNVFIFKAVGFQLPIYIHLLYIPVIMAVSMIPLSINGLGVREGMYVLLYGYAGVDATTAMLCSLLFFTLVTISSLAGGVIILFRK
ncbi:MAG: flippase-like domain-containing protein [Firmicutes bacterium]|nr:flippase-like domain-containing protein [Bacillota bacterium]